MPTTIENPTPEQLARRAYQRAYTRRRRAAALLAANRGATHCQRRQGQSVCGGRLEDRPDRLGRMQVICPRCERRAAGLCRDCPRPVYGKRGFAIRCQACNLKAHAVASAKSLELNRTERNRRWRQRHKARTPEQKALDAARKRAWRLAHPEHIARAKRRESLKQSPRAAAYHAARRKAQRAEIAAKARERYWLLRGAKPVVHCRKCGDEIPRPAMGRPRLTCNACVPRSVAARRLPAPKLALLTPPIPVHAKLGHACLGCDAWIPRGRAKKCQDCKARALAEARDLLRRAGRAA